MENVAMGPVIDLALNGDRTTPVKYAFVLLTRAGDKIEYTTNTMIDDVIDACEGLAQTLTLGENRSLTERIHGGERKPLEVIGEAVRESFKGDFVLISFGVMTGPGQVEYATNAQHESVITMCRGVARTLVETQKQAARNRAFAAMGVA